MTQDEILEQMTGEEPDTNVLFSRAIQLQENDKTSEALEALDQLMTRFFVRYRWTEDEKDKANSIEWLGKLAIMRVIWRWKAAHREQGAKDFHAQIKAMCRLDDNSIS
ncbi:hypothetical protein FACS1894103_5750 [Campylobacterota bacterium]|nr:hypothetical protein FACS1894103_5750 [Campylobacterota bacterium]